MGGFGQGFANGLNAGMGNGIRAQMLQQRFNPQKAPIDEMTEEAQNSFQYQPGFNPIRRLIGGISGAGLGGIDPMNSMKQGFKNGWASPVENVQYGKNLLGELLQSMRG